MTLEEYLNPNEVKALRKIGAVKNPEGYASPSDIKSMRKHFPLALAIFSDEIQDPIPTLEKRTNRMERVLDILEEDKLIDEIAEGVLGAEIQDKLYDLDKITRMKGSVNVKPIQKRYGFEEVIQLSNKISNVRGKPEGSVKKYEKIKDAFDAYFRLDTRISETSVGIREMMTKLTRHLFKEKAKKVRLDTRNSKLLDELTEEHVSKVGKIFNAEAIYRDAVDDMHTGAIAVEKAENKKVRAINMLARTVNLEIEKAKRKQGSKKVDLRCAELEVDRRGRHVKSINIKLSRACTADEATMYLTQVYENASNDSVYNNLDDITDPFRDSHKRIGGTIKDSMTRMPLFEIDRTTSIRNADRGYDDTDDYKITPKSTKGKIMIGALLEEVDEYKNGNLMLPPQRKRIALPLPTTSQPSQAIIGPVKASTQVGSGPIINSNSVKYTRGNMLINPQDYSLIDFLDDVAKRDPNFRQMPLDDYRRAYQKAVDAFNQNNKP